MSRYMVLPRLPVPALSASLARFISALKPLLPDAQLSETVRLTKNFEENEGNYLHKKLMKISENTDNWASQAYIQGKYLSNRSSLILTNSASTIQTRFQWTNTGEKLSTLSRYLVYLLNKVEDIRNERLPQEMARNAPLCMDQYKRMIGVHRLPNPTLDTYMNTPDSKHIVVMHAGNIYKMPVYRSGSRDIVSRDQIEEMLSQVLAESSRVELNRAKSVGLLTALDREAWYLAREEMALSPVNVESLRAVEESLFGLSLDGSDVEDFTGALKLTRFGDPDENFIHFNRWLGLGLQTIFTDSGYLGWSGDHSMFDGSIMSLFENVLIDNSQFGNNVAPASDSQLRVELLKWELSPNIKSKLEEAKSMLSCLYKQYDVHNLEFTDFGKEDIQKLGINFQTFINIAIQLADFKLYNKLDQCYQHVSLRFFKGGRLEQPHIITSESKAFVEGMYSRSLSNKDRLLLLDSAMKKHKEILNDASQGQAYFKHIQALKLIAEEEGLSVDFFQTDSFKKFTVQRFCALFIVSKLPIIGTFVTTNASGTAHCVIFHPIKKNILFSICTLHQYPSTIPSSEFANALESSLRDLNTLILFKNRNYLTSHL